ncbi:MAG: hypothetical protein IPK83_00345 [Planctomycetes bacterium]|nr:hypothetical protein [Planctomycetota bacterium]
MSHLNSITIGLAQHKKFIICLTLSAVTLVAVHADDPPAKSGDTTTQPASKSNDPEPVREPSAKEILRELQEASRKDAKAVVRPGIEGVRPKQIEQPIGNPIEPVQGKLLPDGSRLVDRPGRLAKEGDGFVFSFESRGQGAPDRPIRLLPNRLLEDMEMYSENATKSIVFIISGEITEYRGVNYLLLQKLLVRPDTGNLK